MQLGLVTYMWGAQWDLPTVIKNCQATGFAGVELRSGHKHGVEPALNADQRQRVADAFRDSGVELAGLGSACEYQSPDRATLQKNIDLTKAFIVLAHDLGASGVKVRPNGLPKDVPVEKTLEQIGRTLGELAAFGEGYGVTLRLEVHGHGTDNLDNVRTIMQIAKHPGATVCWNSNPTDTAGKGLEYNFNQVKDRLGTIHIHDLISEYPWQQLFDLLNGTGFDGWTLVEEGAATADPIRVMKYYRLLWERMTAGKA